MASNDTSLSSPLDGSAELPLLDSDYSEREFDEELCPSLGFDFPALSLKHRQLSAMGERVTYKSQQTRKVQRGCRTLSHSTHEPTPLELSLRSLRMRWLECLKRPPLVLQANSENGSDDDAPSKADARRLLMSQRSTYRLRSQRAKKAAQHTAKLAAQAASLLAASVGDAKQRPHDPRSTSRRAPNPLLRTDRSAAAAAAAAAAVLPSAKPGIWLVRHPAGFASSSTAAGFDHFSSEVLPLLEAHVRAMFDDETMVGCSLLDGAAGRPRVTDLLQVPRDDAEPFGPASRLVAHEAPSVQPGGLPLRAGGTHVHPGRQHPPLDPRLGLQAAQRQRRQLLLPR